MLFAADEAVVEELAAVAGVAEEDLLRGCLKVIGVPRLDGVLNPPEEEPERQSIFASFLRWREWEGERSGLEKLMDGRRAGGGDLWG